MDISNSGRDLVRSGGAGNAKNCARAGYFPIALERVPLGAFDGLSIFLRHADRSETSPDAFRLYSSASIRFAQKHRDRLIATGVRFVYIPISEQNRFFGQIESSLNAMVDDSSLTTSIKAELIYETSVELMNEVLADPQIGAMSARIENVSRAITSLVLKDPRAFAHLFAASHHDFYTATHVVNVATWMVPLAVAVGYQDPTELNHICQAGLLHDIGKIRVSNEVLNRRGELSDGDWALIREHAELGYQHLLQFKQLPQIVSLVARQHHERLDGSGYPNQLVAKDIHPISRICALVDSFDAMTAFRPFKEKTMSVATALRTLMAETPAKYDPKIVEKWTELLQSAEREGVLSEPVMSADGTNHRKFPRFPIQCLADVFMIGADINHRPVSVIAHNLSRSGAGFFGRKQMQPGLPIRLRLRGSGALDREYEGIVTRCRAYSDGNHEIGMKFSKLDDETVGNELGASDTGARELVSAR